MNKTLATSLTTTLFLVIGISGVMMYFHIFSSQVKDLHEILGLVFVGAVLFHVFYNFKSMQKYFTKRVFIAVSFLTIIVSSAFIIQSSNKGENPKGKIIQMMLKAPIEESFSILKVSNAKEKLEKENLHLGKSTTIEELAKENKTSPFKIISILTR